MGSRIQQIVITQSDAVHGALGMSAVMNTYWTDYFNPVFQAAITIGGLIYLYYMIRAKRTEWLLNKRKLTKEEN